MHLAFVIVNNVLALIYFLLFATAERNAKIAAIIGLVIFSLLFIASIVIGYYQENLLILITMFMVEIPLFALLSRGLTAAKKLSAQPT